MEKSFVNILSLASILVLFPVTDSDFLCNLGDPTDCGCVFISTPPVDTDAVYESDVTLECKVDSVRGNEVQWTKNGVALGEDPAIPGYDRYSMASNSQSAPNGNYDLIITNVQLVDEATYQCQVTDCNIQSNDATITVLVPPYGPVIIDEEEGGEYKVVVNETIQIVCEAWNAKPPANVMWFKGNDQITQGVTTEVYQSETPLHNSSATLRLTPSLTDNGEIYTCIMNNDALIADDPAVIPAQKNDIFLTVLVPPIGPIIDLYDPSKGTYTVQENEPFTLTCRAIDGKPAPTVTWYRENERIVTNVDTIVSPSDEFGRQNVTSILHLIGNVSDDNARFTCRVMSEALDAPKSLTLTLQVQTPVNVAVVVACVIAALLLLIIIIVIVAFIVKRRRKRNKKLKALEGSQERFPPQAATDEAQHESAKSTTTSPSSIKKEVDFDIVSYKSLSSLQAADNAAYETLEEDEKEEDETETSSSSSSDESSEDEHGEQEGSVKLPDGDLFSLSSSMWRSTRGSPVSFLYDELRIPVLPPSPDVSWITSISGSIPQYVVRRPSTGMTTDV